MRNSPFTCATANQTAIPSYIFEIDCCAVAVPHVRSHETRQEHPTSHGVTDQSTAILAAAQNLSHRPRQNRKIIFLISDGKEYGSRASYAQVLKVLLTDEIAVYAIGVDSAAMPLYNKIEKAWIPGFGYSNILPRYANATGGDVLDEFSKESIESAYQRITLEARNQYTLGYNTPQKPSSSYREIEVRVRRPGLEVFAKHGYYPLPPQRAEVQPLTPDQPPPGSTEIGRASC